jgi:hypothetical protein
VNWRQSTKNTLRQFSNETTNAAMLGSIFRCAEAFDPQTSILVKSLETGPRAVQFEGIDVENGDSERGEATMGMKRAQALWNRLGWTGRVRPMIFGAFVADFLAPDRRTIIETKTGLKFLADPLSNFGESLVRECQYEPETEQIIREHLFVGDRADLQMV